MSNFEYDPVVFLRCHSNKFDPKADIQTQVWHTEFEPDQEIPHQSSNIVATSGGHSICFLDIKENKVKKKYYATNSLEVFYCFTWISIPCDSFDSITVLVAGSSAGKLHIIYPSQDKAAGEISLTESKKSKKNISAINSVCVFKDDQNNQALLCGMSTGVILGVELKCTKVDSAVKCDSIILGSFSVSSEPFQIDFCATTQTVLAACNNGLIGIHVPSREFFKNNNYQVTKFHPVNKYQKKDCELADSVQIIGNGLVSVKYAHHGVIYIFDLKDTVRNCQPNKSSATVEFTPKYVLEWSNTDNYFLNIGVNKAANLLACGDDKGTIWLYDIKSIESGGPVTSQKILPTSKIEWPTVNDKYSAKKKKLKLDVYDIVINKVAIHSSATHVVKMTKGASGLKKELLKQNVII